MVYIEFISPTFTSNEQQYLLYLMNNRIYCTNVPSLLNIQIVDIQIKLSPTVESMEVGTYNFTWGPKS